MASFTALNGNDPKPLASPRRSPPVKRPGSEERAEAVAPSQHRTTGDVSAVPRDQWSSTTGADRLPYPYAEVERSSKRKRSDSAEPRRDGPSTSEERETAPPSQPPAETRDVYGTRERDYRPYEDEGRDHDEPWYSREQRERGGYDQQDSAGSVPSQTDEQINEALRRGTEDSQGQYSPTSPDDGDESGYYGSYSADRREDSLVQSDPKKRKRNFSNRTKTGCLTCRRRKKKCDEQKPECKWTGVVPRTPGGAYSQSAGQNCLRGAFICAGYPNQRGFQKTENKPLAVPLESKDPSYVPPGAYGMPQSATAYPNTPIPPPPRRDSGGPLYRGQPLRIDPPQGRPILTDDDRHTGSTIQTASTASTTSPDNKPSAFSSHTNMSNVFPTPVSAINSSFGPKEFKRIPPLHDSSRTEPETPQTAGPPSLRQINIFNPARTSSPPSQPVQPPPLPPPPPPPIVPPGGSAQTTNQLALSRSHFPPPRQQTQKELMLQGQFFRPLDKELLLERERCNAACWRFNNSTNPNNGVSATERSRLFKEILVPTEPVNLSPTSPVSRMGRVGEEVIVEAPFTCDYGYNLAIASNVFIGRNCTFLDCASIKIGKNTYIGPNVSIFTAELDQNPSCRMGGKSLQKATPVIIEEDVWIGGNVTILPGRRVGKGSTVSAGAVVNKVRPARHPPHTVS